jgi:hypothetical protein
LKPNFEAARTQRLSKKRISLFRIDREEESPTDDLSVGRVIGAQSQNFILELRAVTRIKQYIFSQRAFLFKSTNYFAALEE